MEAIRGSDLVLLVAEPTPFGLHDLSVVVALCRELDLPTAAVINRADLGDDRVRAFCESKRVPVLDALPFDPELAAAGAEGRAVAADSTAHRERFGAIGRAAMALAEGRR
jgi:MinD superfamily P-loop ATPase